MSILRATKPGPGRAAEKLLATPGMRTIPVRYGADHEPKAQVAARHRKADASVSRTSAKGTASDALRGFLIVAGAVVIIAAGVAAGIYMMA